MRIKSRRVVLWNYDEPFANVSSLGVVRMRCNWRFALAFIDFSETQFLFNINRQTKTSGALAIILEA